MAPIAPAGTRNSGKAIVRYKTDAAADLRNLCCFEKRAGKNCGTRHLAKNERDAPNFLYAALDMAACAFL